LSKKEIYAKTCAEGAELNTFSPSIKAGIMNGTQPKTLVEKSAAETVSSTV
jgi:hypothetical protein